MRPNHFHSSKTALELIQRRLDQRASDAEAHFGLHPLQGITTVFVEPDGERLYIDCERRPLYALHAMSDARGARHWARGGHLIVIHLRVTDAQCTEGSHEAIQLANILGIEVEHGRVLLSR